jgi:hypothetical protein
MTDTLSILSRRQLVLFGAVLAAACVAAALSQVNVAHLINFGAASWS